MPCHSISPSDQERLPKYQYAKLVSASKILTIIPPAEGKPTAELTLLTGKDSEPVKCTMSKEWYDLYRPYVGGYFIIYPDGACAFMPFNTFRESHTLVWVSGVTVPVLDN